MSGLYRTPGAEVTPGLAAVRARYDALAADLAAVAAAPVADPAPSAAAAAVLAAEARRLDHGRWQDWLGWCGEDTVLWVPLDVRAAHPGDDQSLFLDDRRRLDERIWRFTDPSAWALHPAGTVVRGVSGVEAWPSDDGMLVSSVLSIQHVRAQRTWATTARQVHRLRGTGGGWRLVHKILLIPRLEAGGPHLGWLL
jgi:3-phenylpropionate/cinnamic acid dioxygenase small subunit